MVQCSRSRRRQSALISEEKKLAPTDVGHYILRPFSPLWSARILALVIEFRLFSIAITILRTRTRGPGHPQMAIGLGVVNKSPQTGKPFMRLRHTDSHNRRRIPRQGTVCMASRYRDRCRGTGPLLFSYSENKSLQNTLLGACLNSGSRTGNLPAVRFRRGTRFGLDNRTARGRRRRVQGSLRRRLEPTC